MKTKKRNVKKILLGNLIGLLVLSGAFFIFWKTEKSQAGAIASISASVSGTTYTITFTPETTIPATGKIFVRFQMNECHNTVVPASLARGGNTTANISSLEQSSSNEIRANLGSEIAGGTEITIEAEGLTNPETGRYYLTVLTKTEYGVPIDGDIGPTSLYRAYYTIGTPLATGQVLDPDGDPVEGAWVNLSEYNNTGGESFYGYDDSDDQGYYAIGSAEYGATVANGAQVRIVANAPSENFQWGMTEEYTHTYAESTISQNLQFTLPTKTISGRVVYSNGSPVANATVNLWSSDSNGCADSTTDSGGNYSVLVKGGKWDVMPQPESDSGWVYGMHPMSASFEKNAVVESQTVNFTVQRANATVTGTVRLPDGLVPSNPDRFSVDICSMAGMGAHGQLDSSGSFSLNVAAGSYQVDVMDIDQNYAAPEMTPFSVSENETASVGTITLIARDAYITGTISDENGNGVVGINIDAFRMRGMGWGQGVVNNSGTAFTIKVFPGKWMVNIPPFTGGGDSYVLDGNPEQVEISSGETATVNISLVAATATIRGSILDTSGNMIADSYGFVFADRAGSSPFMGPGLGGTVSQGSYTVSVPPGTYNVGMGMMPGADYSAGEPAEITVTDNQIVTNNITVYENDMTVSGEIRDENGNKVTNAFMEIFATNKTGAWQNAFVNQADGTYSLRLSSAVDPWSLGYFIDPSTGYFSEKLTDNSISGNSGDSLAKNITIRRADATISGRVLDGDGNPMEGVKVFADNRSSTQERDEIMFMGPMFMNDNVSNSNGEFIIQVPHGTYFVSASLPRSSRPDLINPNRVEVVLEENQTISGIELAFKKSDSTISGTVTLDGASNEEAYVWAWSESGGYNEAEAEDDGSFNLNVTQNDTWHMGVNNDVESSTDYVKSGEEVIETENQAAITQNIDLETVSGGLADPLSTTFTSTNSKVANLSDGSRISIPANAMGTSGNVTLNATTTSEVPRTTSAKPIGTGMELTASDSSGASVNSFNSNVTVSFPYDEDELGDMLITEDDLVAAYWDENNGMWQPMDNYSIDKDNNKVVFSTSHFTTFALVSDTATDSDFSDEDSNRSRPKIYRWSAERYYPQTEELKEKLKMAIWGLHFRRDATVSIGNEEADSDDVKVSPGGRKLIAKFEMKDLLKKYDPKRSVRVTNPDGKDRKAVKKIDLRNISLKVDTNEIETSTSEGITDIQNILKNLGFFNHPSATGYYGPITTQAVIEFQKAHGIDPVGVVGPITSAKLLEVKGNL